jgi:hypothetical protein
MSEKEVKKWENKFRLFVQLHPEFMQDHNMFNFQSRCSSCIHTPVVEGHYVGVLHCPSNRLVTGDFVKLFPYEEGMDDVYCVEWIKNA